MSNRTLSVASAIEAHRLSSDVPFICLLDIEIIDPLTGSIVNTLRYANNSEDLTFSGSGSSQLYGRGTFDISFSEEAGSIGDVTLTVNDFTQALQGLMEANGGGVGSRIAFYVANGRTLETETVEFFKINGAVSQGYTQSFTLGAEDVLAQVFPRRRQTRDFCQHRYKGPDCKYAGEIDSCDLSLSGGNGCAAHSNTINFGAFPGLNNNGFRYV
jgi:hypothetical protein